ncbi:MAG: Por secretion system protein [Bacteroidaceae bacterium]|nr:Por secretion system protein [Bacteroidaceae bacterium]
MRKLLFILLLCCAGIHCVQANDWTIYAAYHGATKAVKTDSRIFVLAQGGLYSYDTDDQLIEAYDKTNTLSDCGIYDIAYSTQLKCLVVLYDNGNIDLLGMDNTRWNLSDLKNKTLNDKTLNELKVVGEEALISLNEGLAVINLKEGYFKDFYTFGSKVKAATLVNGKLYANTAAGVKEGDRAKNLLDMANWMTVSASTVTFGPTAEEQEAAAKWLEQVKDIVPNSPVRNYAYHLNMQGNRLLVAGGNFYYPNVNYPGTAMKYENGRWTAFDEEEAIALVGKNTYMNVTDIAQDPNDPEHHWLGTMRSGIYEFKDYKLKNHYTYDNSPLTSILPNSTNAQNYVRVTALAFDAGNNLWMMNNECDVIVRILKKDGTWTELPFDELKENTTFDHIIFDQRGWMWSNSRRDANGTRAAGILVMNTNGTLDNTRDDHYKFITAFQNQDGVAYDPDYVYCITETLDGTIWIGTNLGLFVCEDPTTLFNNNFHLSQLKVPRNDGSGLADYLMNSVNVKCITIDGGNRKWIGTVDDGVYLLSADGMQTLEHFTATNSPLISNEINDIAINGETGEVFIATTKGLCSYRGDATDPAASMRDNTLKVYPNPVRPDYHGKVHITGLMQNSNVKIVSAAGKLVAEGTSVGGEFSWNGCMQSGRRVASGIYYALCTDEEGNEGACAKILIVHP